MGLRQHDSALFLASVVTVASFLAATIYTQSRLLRLDAISTMLETNSVPSIEYLARASTTLTRLHGLLEEGATGSRAGTRADTLAQLQRFEESVGRYLRLAPLPGEEHLWRTLRTEAASAGDTARVTISAYERGQTDRAAVLLRTAHPAFERASRAMWDCFEFDIQQSQRLAREVRNLRESTRNTGALLNLAAAVVSIVAATIAFRASRHHDRLVDAHRALLSERVQELDRFAGRVAHDIVSPLGTISFSLHMLADPGTGLPGTHVERAQRGLQRVQQLVDGLLTFARSGARGDGDARCSVDTVLNNASEDCAATAHAAGVELVIERSGGLEVCCSFAVVTSIVENLVRNAIKYTASRPIRKVQVRVARRGEFARFEVADTGPGIPPHIQDTLFEPFVRGHDEGSGVGLGLATVKRLVDAHGGSIDVRTQQGVGSTFCVDLPLVNTLPKLEPFTDGVTSSV